MMRRRRRRRRRAGEPLDTRPFFGHDREEVTRILLQSLSDLGYRDTARHLTEESGYELESPTVAGFRAAVLSGQWDEAEALLCGTDPAEQDGGVSLGNGHGGGAWRKGRASLGRQNGYSRQGLPLVEGADVTMLKFLIRQQKYLELLQSRDLNSALSVLRHDLTPLKRDVDRLHRLSSLIMCDSVADLQRQADWDGADGESRSHLLSELSRAISPAVMIPEHRLATLLTSVQDQRILSCRYHNSTAPPSLYTDHECSRQDFPLEVSTVLRNHSDEVWHLAFSHDGSLLATAGKDGLVCVYETRTWSLRHELREHDRGMHAAEAGKGVCYVAFSPDDRYLISCAQNNEFVVVDVRDGRRVAYADHFRYPVTTAAWLPDSQTFVVGSQCSERPLSLYRLGSYGSTSTSTSTAAAAASASTSTSTSSISRNNEIWSWRDPPWRGESKDVPNSFRITDCSVNATGTRMAATTLDNRVMLYDLPSKAKMAEWHLPDRLTSINFSLDGAELLLSTSHGRLLSLSAATGDEVMRFEGAAQRDFVIRSTFGGAGENFVVSGSEDQKVYIWRRQTGRLVAALDACERGMVNAVAWSPTDPALWASAGDDRQVRM